MNIERYSCHNTFLLQVKFVFHTVKKRKRPRSILVIWLKAKEKQIINYTKKDLKNEENKYTATSCRLVSCVEFYLFSNVTQGDPEIN